ncbi:MAG: hypothetical protein SHS37scaffold145_3 [Phage 71_18]|nr:MAG: hypothetical protein SHS37scaffold145_3 [Phage 71_18]
MPNPYAPRPRIIDGAPSFPEGRLRRLGMSEDELTDARAGWDAMTEAELVQAADALAVLTDEELAQQIAEARQDSPAALLGVVPPPEGGEAATAPGGGPGADPSTSDDTDTTGQRLGKLLEWIGDDVSRAEQALAAEMARDPKPRAQRLEALEAKVTELRG